MSAKGTFTFANYILRPAGAIQTDRLLAKQWTEADLDHAGVDPSFWLEQDFDRDSYLLLDQEGALFFWKGIIRIDNLLEDHSRVIEMHIQFPPLPPWPWGVNETQERARLKTRITAGLIDGLAWLEALLRQANYKEMYFDSQTPTLIRFAERHLGFVREGQRLRKLLATPVESV